jgi:hypothetical protein
MTRAHLHFLCGKPGAGKSTLDGACLQRIARRNEERPEGSHHLSDEVFFQVAAYFQAPDSDEGLQVLRHSA